MQLIQWTALLTTLWTGVQAQDGQNAFGAGKIVLENRPALIRLSSQITTTIRLPEPVSSVVVGDSTWLYAEYSPLEPLTVFARSLSGEPAESNLVISTTSGRQFVLIVKSVGNTRDRSDRADLLVTCKAAGGLFVEDAFPDSLIAETIRLDSGPSTDSQAPANPTAIDLPPLADLLTRQSRTPVSKLHGVSDGIRVSIGKVIDQGDQLVVLFSVIGATHETAELLPPQVQLAGRTKSGIFGRARWTTAEQLPVRTYLMTSRRLAAGGRVDGVVVFDRPSLKQSTEELLLQIADSAAIDKPVLAPISFRSTNPLEDGL